MNTTYLELLQTIAAIPIQFIQADKNGDGKVDTGELINAVFGFLPRLTTITQQWEDFTGHFEGYEFKMVVDDLRKLVSIQLLPDTYAKYEASIDDFTLATAKIVEGLIEAKSAIDSFPKREGKKQNNSGRKGDRLSLAIKKAKI